jgi:cytochrome c2
MLTSDDPASTTNAANLAKTCAQCHQHAEDEPSEAFVERTAGIIHQQEGVRDNNPLVKLLRLVPGGK